MSESWFDEWLPLWICLPAGIAVYSIVSKVRRRMEMRSLAARIGFAFVGDTLPVYLDRVDTVPTQATAVRNVIDGELKGIRVVAFDYGAKARDVGPCGTAIAARTDRDVFGSIPPNRAMTTERSGAWTVVYQPARYNLPSGVIPLRELEGLLQGIV